MVEEKIPRRLKRFYRTGDKSQEYNNYYSNNSDSFNDTNYSQDSKIPTMDYEDIDEKNLEDIKKVEQQSLEEKLALLEIEKFKKEKKRMPSKEEQDQLASSLYEQFKNNENDDASAPNSRQARISPRQRRMQRIQDTKSDNFDIKEEPIMQNQENINQNPVNDIKSLFDDDTSKSSKKKDDFDMEMDLESDDDLEMSGDLEELEDFSMDKKKKKKI